MQQNLNGASIRERASLWSGARARQTAPEAGALPFKSELLRHSMNADSVFPSWLHKHRQADPDEIREKFRVPVREAKTAVRFSAPDLFRPRRPVNSVAGFVEADPDRAHRIVRPRREDELAVEFSRLRGL